MTIQWLTRKAEGAPMPVEFKPFHIPLQITGAIGRMKSLVDGKVVGLMLQGKSIQELENRIEEFKDLDIVWIAMNRFDIYQKYILDKINKSLRVVLDVGQVKNVYEYESIIRIPKWKTYLDRPESNILISCNKIIDSIREIQNIFRAYIGDNRKIIQIPEIEKIKVPNSLTLYLMVLAKFNIKKIILFGCDGFGNPKAFKDTPIWNASEFESEKWCNKTIISYYRPEAVLEERKLGYSNERQSNLHSDSPTMNDQYRKTIAFYCNDYNLKVPNVINCSPSTLHTCFPKISYDQLKGEVE